MADPINFKFPLRQASAGGFETNDTTLNAVADDLRILILTNYGERPIHYDFGANLRGIIFEQQGDILRTMVSDAIIAAIDKWMPFVNILEIMVDDVTTVNTLRENEVHVTIRYSVGNIDDVRVLKQILRA